MNKHPDLSILVINFNTSEVTLECLRSIVGETHATNFEIIVVDNASKDGSGDAIRSEFPDLTLIELKENIGFGRANNLAAQKAKGEFLLLLNPDTVVLDTAIDTLMQFAERNPNCGIWGGRTLFGDRSLNPTSCWREMSIWGLFSRAFGLSTLFPKSAVFNSDAYGGWLRDSIREVDTVTGCFLLTRKDLWETLGGFDPAFYMYGEEADFCLRAREIGAHPTVTPEAVIIHYGGLSETVPADKIERLFSANMTFANKHWPKAKILLAMFLFSVLAGVRALAFTGAAALLRKPSCKKKAYIWRNVWRRRAVWLKGFP